MQTFLFNDLSQRAQDAALAHYGRELASMDTLNSSLDTLDLIRRMIDEAWRFTEHGERIA